jgi:hypothetical protein
MRIYYLTVFSLRTIYLTESQKAGKLGSKQRMSKVKGQRFWDLFTAEAPRSQRNLYLATHTDCHSLFFLDIPSKKKMLVRLFPYASIAI